MNTGVVCPFCASPMTESALFCANCGQEVEGYAERMQEIEPPVVPEFMQRVQLQGKPAIRIVLAILAAMLAGVPLAVGLQAATDQYFLVLDILMGTAILLCAWPQQRELLPLLKPGPLPWWPIGLAGALALPAVAHLYTQLLPDLPGLDQNPFEGMSVAMLIVTVCIFPGIFEELAFRGIFYGNMKQMMRPVTTHMLTAGVFAAIHFSPLIFPYHFLVGLFLGWLRARSGSLWPAMLAHTAHNAAVMFVYPS